MTSKIKTPPRSRDGQAAELPAWQSTPCPSWCDWQPHSEREAPEERHHTSRTLQQPLTLMAPAEVSGGEFEPEYLAAYLWQHVREAEPAVYVAKGEAAESFRLTLEEAEAVARTLLELVAQARAAS